MTSLTTSSQLGIGSLAPPQQTQQERFAELQSLVAPSQQQARDVAMGNALTRFGSAMQTPGLSLAQAFGYAAPQFSETMNKHRQAVADRNLQLQLAARAEQKAAEKESRELSYKVYTSQLSKIPDVEFGTYYNPNMPELAPSQGARLPNGQTVVLNPETQEWGPGDSFVEAPAGVQTAYAEMTRTDNVFTEQLKKADKSKATIIDPNNIGNKNEVTVYTHPLWSTQYVNAGGQYVPLKDAYPYAVSGTFDDNVEVKKEAHRVIISPKSTLKVPTEDGGVEFINTPMVEPTTNIHQKYYQDANGKTVNREEYVDSVFSSKNQEGALYANQVEQISSLSTLSESEFKAEQARTNTIQRSLEKIDNLLGDRNAMNFGQTNELVGFVNALKRKVGNTGFASVGALFMGGDEAGVLTAEQQARVKQELEQITKDIIRSEKISGRGAVWEQILFRQQTGVETADDLFGSVTTLEGLRVIRTRLHNTMLAGIGNMSPQGSSVFQVKTPPSFKVGDEGMIDGQFMNRNDVVGLQYRDGSDTHHHIKTIMNLHDLKGDGITNAMKINLLRNRFAVLSPQAQASYQNATGAPFPAMQNGRVNLYDLAATVGITFED